jgi:ribonuclease HII
VGLSADDRTGRQQGYQQYRDNSDPEPHRARLYLRVRGLSNRVCAIAGRNISQAVKSAGWSRRSAVVDGEDESLFAFHVGHGGPTLRIGPHSGPYGPRLECVARTGLATLPGGLTCRADFDWRTSCCSGMIIAMPSRTILIGIDEAGYGPILGPLVVSAAAFEVPVAVADACLWEALKESVSPTRSARKSRIPILDSKKLFSRSDGLAKLERSVLAVMTAWRGMPPTLRGLVGLLCPELLAKLPEYPWYRDADPKLPRAADAGGVRLAASLLRRDLDGHSIRCAGFWSEVLPERHYNRLVDSTQNKAVVLSGLTLRLMQRVADAYPDQELRFAVDKQGAREVYGPLLLRAFEDRRLKVLDETPEHSAYELSGGRAAWRVSFSQSGESRHLLVALASLMSKYLREALMECFNAFWSSHVPELKPTAGYYEDGLRFLKDIQPHLRRLGIEKEWLVRQR